MDQGVRCVHQLTRLFVRRKESRVATRYQIVDGPSKFDMMLSLFTGSKVTFRVYKQEQIDEKVWRHNASRDPILTLEGRLCMLEQEDGSLESWNFVFHAGKVIDSAKGYYSTKSRKGTMLVD